MTYNNVFKNYVYLGLLLLVLILFIFIEAVINTNYAPETIFIKNQIPNTVLSECHAEIFSSQVNESYKSLEKLSSLYEYLDPDFFIVANDENYFALNTGLLNYTQNYEINIFCGDGNNFTLMYTASKNDVLEWCIVQNKGRIKIC